MLDLIANIASILGLGFTVYVLIELKRLQRAYALIYRVPEYADQLSILATKLSQQIDDTDARRGEIGATLAGMKANLESIARNIGKQHEKPYSALRDRIAKLERTQRLTQDRLEDISTTALHLAQRAKDMAEDRKHRLG